MKIKSWTLLLMVCCSAICLTMCTPMGNNDKSAQGTRLIVFNYHLIGESDDPYSVPVETFSQQVQYLLNQGYKLIDTDDYWSWRQGKLVLPDKTFMLTFDDGNLSDYEKVYPYLIQNKLKGVFFLQTNKIDTPGHLTQSQVHEMYESGFCKFGSHSNSSRNLPGLDEVSLDTELQSSKEILEGLLGDNVKSFAYPKGFWNQEVIEALYRQGYEFAFTVMPGTNYKNTNPMELRRILVDRELSFDQFILYVQNDPKLYEKYYTAMLEKTTRDKLISIARVCRQELAKLNK